MADVTAVRQLVLPSLLDQEWTYGKFESGLITYEIGEFKLKFEGDFTVFEFLTGTADTMKLVQNGKVMFKIEGLTVGNSELGAFESGLNFSILDAMNAILNTADDINGGDDDDFFFGFGGADTMKGGAGADYLDGGIGKDKIYGGSGRDDIEGDLGNDKIWGGKGNDILDGDDGNDRIYGGKGKDLIEGDEDDDVLFGGQGADTFNFDFGDGDNVIRDFGLGADRLDFDLTGPVITADEFVLAYVSKSGGNTFIESGGFSVELRGFTTSRMELADMIDLTFLNM